MQCVIWCPNLSAGAVQSILTGESVSVEKTLDAVLEAKAVYQDKTCILFSVCGFPPSSCVCKFFPLAAQRSLCEYERSATVQHCSYVGL